MSMKSMAKKLAHAVEGVEKQGRDDAKAKETDSVLTWALVR
jgi:hypothetical protein